AACIFFVTVPLVHTSFTLLLTMALFAFALALTNATLPALITNASPEKVRGTILGVGSSLDAIAGVVMPAFSTAILTYYGPAWTGAVSAFFCFIALALGIRAQRRGGITSATRPAA
ncbi:MAG TPA: MFS transporter, partial [Candidatus Baltobacteraceae bacterium]|nr:MFS transporter [Candidatus Baltobacteraceae bacterium]